MYFRPQAAEKALRTSEQVLVSMAMTHSSLLSADPGRLSAPHCSFCHSQEEQSLTFNKKRLIVVFLCSSTNSLIDPWSSPWHSPYLTWISGPNIRFGAALSPWPWQQVAIEVVGFYGHLSHRNSASISRCMMRIFRAPLVGSMKTKPVA